MCGSAGCLWADAHRVSSPPLDHGGLSWNLRVAGLMLPGLWLVREGLGRSTASNTHPVHLPNTGKEPPPHPGIHGPGGGGGILTLA